MNRKKIIKLVIAGVAILIIGTVIIVNSQQIMEYGTQLYRNIIPMKETVVSAFNSNSVELSQLHAIGDPSKCTDMDFLKYIIETEKNCHLQKGELLSLIFGENSFTHKTVMDSGSLSYGCSQMKLETAKGICTMLKDKGITIQTPTEDLLRNDHRYLINLTGRYLEILHQKFSNPLQVYTVYNAGEPNFLKFASNGYHYSYTDNMLANIKHFAGILNKA